MIRKKTGLIYALDQSVWDAQTQEHLASIAPYVDYIKIGLEAMTAIRASGRSVATEALEFAEDIKKPVMFDIKLLDVQNTMVNAARNIVRYAPLFTLHAQASDDALKSIAEIARLYSSIPLAVTVLTDLDDDQCVSRFSSLAPHAVTRFARLAYANGIRGFVLSPKEVAIARDALGGGVTIVTPGVRPAWYVRTDEQKRVTTPTDAARAGADLIVVGRPIGSAADAKRIRDELDAA